MFSCLYRERGFLCLWKIPLVKRVKLCEHLKIYSRMLCITILLLIWVSTSLNSHYTIVKKMNTCGNNIYRLGNLKHCDFIVDMLQLWRLFSYVRNIFLVIQSRRGPRLCSTKLSMKFLLLIKTKIPTNEDVSCFQSLRS